ncbi:hypothetical protein [Roseiconus lacunae]|uniref:hypothetical protein n=1 Tax=Roseiconus lacunae TaxID=2605694 RepID=UPI0011F0A1EB|nr:hypothetical protein [Roseiconus lacunae]
MSRFHDRVRAGYGRTAQQSEDPAEYRRGDIFESIQATISDPKTRGFDDDGFAIRHQQTQILIRPVFLTPVFEKAKIGDLITFHTLQRQFVVVDDPSTNTCTTPSDASAAFHRVHVDEIDYQC